MSLPPHAHDDPRYATEEAQLFHEGLMLFNDGEWFECHEVWEDIWHLATGETKAFYQGLIQCAVSLEHVRRGNPRGVRSVWQSAQTKFEGLPDVFMGVDISKLLRELREYLTPILTLPDHRFAPGESRGQDLPVDLAEAPRIALVYDPFAQDRQSR